MQLLESEYNVQSLSRFGEEAIDLFMRKDFSGLAARFGYALAFNRDLAEAIEEDLERAVRDAKEAGPCSRSGRSEITVKFFSPNPANLLAVVECRFQFSEGVWLAVDLISTGKGTMRHLTLEDVSYVA